MAKQYVFLLKCEHFFVSKPPNITNKYRIYPIALEFLMVESTSIHWQPAGSSTRLYPFRGVYDLGLPTDAKPPGKHMGPISPDPKP